MNLNQHSAERRLAIFEDLQAGRRPREGSYDEHALKEARAKASPQLGATRYEPHAIICEFIYAEVKGPSSVIVVRLEPPERIVFLPVPSWVMENVWQGDVTGSFHFESDATRLVEEFRGELTKEANEKWFGPQAAKRRE